MPARRIAVVTGTRAEFGLLQWLVEDIHRDPDLELLLVVTGAHLAPEHGKTVAEIEARGFPIARRIEMLLSDDSAVGATKSMGVELFGLAEAWRDLRPDLLVLLGDRYEILAAAASGLMARIPMAHLHGGEVTLGAVDESIRHAVTKLCHLHFVAAEPYRARVIQMGENPAQVFTVGALGLDTLTRTALPGRPELEASLGFALGDPLFLVTQHPATAVAPPAEAVGTPSAMGSASSGRNGDRGTEQILAALSAFPEATVVLTHPNADPGNSAIRETLESFAAHRPRTHLVSSLGQIRYLGLLKVATAVIGNSSSGLIEAPACGCPTVNVGPRQDGRLRATSVIDCPEDAAAIEAGIRRALSPEFRRTSLAQPSPYAGQDVAAKILSVLKTVDLRALRIKPFFDAKQDRPPK